MAASVAGVDWVVGAACEALSCLLEVGNLLLHRAFIATPGLERVQQLRQRLIQRRLGFLLADQIGFGAQLLSLNVLVHLTKHRVLLAGLAQGQFLLLDLIAVTTGVVAVHLGQHAAVAIGRIAFARLGRATAQGQDGGEDRQLS